MIIEREPLTLGEVEETLKKIPDSEKKEQTRVFIKKFLKTKPEQAKKIREELEKLDLLKLKKEHVVKTVDLMPEDISDLNKIFADVNLNEDEANKILEIIKKNR